MSILIFILVLSLLVFVHELGHYYAARRFKVGVLEFGFGFPPRLWGFKRHGTQWSINLIPFGGFVRLEGESDASITTPSSFAQAPLRRKFIILAAGVIMNYLLAWGLLSAALTVGVTVDPTQLTHNRWQQLSAQRVHALISSGGLAERSGLQGGDELVSVNNQVFKSTEDLINYTRAQDYPNLEIIVRRQQQIKSILIETPSEINANQPVYGFGLQPLATLAYPWYVSGWFGLQSTGSFVAQTFVGFGNLLRDLVTTGRVSQDLAGPVGIAILTGEVSRLGFSSLLQFVAILSVSLAVINFLPLPALDGGRALFVVIERLRGRPVNPRWEQAIHATGFYLLLLALVLISIRDVRRFGLLERLMNLFQT